jgi:hydroxymethylbilane synthase
MEEGDLVLLRGLVGRPDATEILREEVRGPAAAAAELGRTLASRLFARGADRILAEL